MFVSKWQTAELARAAETALVCYTFDGELGPLFNVRPDASKNDSAFPVGDNHHCTHIACVLDWDKLSAKDCVAIKESAKLACATSFINEGSTTTAEND